MGNRRERVLRHLVHAQETKLHPTICLVRSSHGPPQPDILVHSCPPKGIRWKLDIQEYSMALTCIKGEHNQPADELSRLCPLGKEAVRPLTIANLFETERIPDKLYQIIRRWNNTTRGHFGSRQTLERTRNDPTIPERRPHMAHSTRMRQAFYTLMSPVPENELPKTCHRDLTVHARDLCKGRTVVHRHDRTPDPNGGGLPVHSVRDLSIHTLCRSTGVEVNRPYSGDNA
jgi:hypothetical protein